MNWPGTSCTCRNSGERTPKAARPWPARCSPWSCNTPMKTISGPWTASPFWLIVVCVGKAVLCGLCAGLAAKALEKKQTLSCIAAALVAPVVNTGVFAVGMLTVFRPILAQYAGGTDVVTYLFVAFIGVNFLVEFAVNAVLSAAIARIVQVVRKQLEK